MILISECVYHSPYLIQGVPTERHFLQPADLKAVVLSICDDHLKTEEIQLLAAQLYVSINMMWNCTPHAKAIMFHFCKRHALAHHS